MKRISMAEQTLKKQIDRMLLDRKSIQDRINELKTEVSTLDRQLTAIENEMNQLRNTREAASRIAHTPGQLKAVR